MPMYNLLEYSQNYSMTSGSLGNYYRDEIDDVDANSLEGKPFKYKTKIVEKTETRADQTGNEVDADREDQPPLPTLNTEVVVSLIYLSDLREYLDLPLINYEIELDMKWTRNCLLMEEDDSITGASFTITSTKIYVPIVTFSVNNNIKFLENIKQGFKRTISWNKYRSEIIAQLKNKNLDYLMDPTFRYINRLFVLSFKNGENDPTIKSYCKYYMPLVAVKD